MFIHYTYCFCGCTSPSLWLYFKIIFRLWLIANFIWIRFLWFFGYYSVSCFGYNIRSKKQLSDRFNVSHYFVVMSCFICNFVNNSAKICHHCIWYVVIIVCLLMVLWYWTLFLYWELFSCIVFIFQVYDWLYEESLLLLHSGSGICILTWCVEQDAIL